MMRVRRLRKTYVVTHVDYLAEEMYQVSKEIAKSGNPGVGLPISLFNIGASSNVTAGYMTQVVKCSVTGYEVETRWALQKVYG